MAVDMGNSLVATLICLGNVFRRLEVIPLEKVNEALDVRGRKFGEKVLELNKAAIKKGWDLAD